MSNIIKDLHAVGLNPFGVVLVAESMLKSPIAPISADDKPLTFFMPINRGDCAGWVGVEFTLKAVRAEQPNTTDDRPQVRSI
jgi:hypothetical protein